MKELKEILSECMREAVSIEDLAERLISAGVVYAPRENAECEIRNADKKHIEVIERMMFAMPTHKVDGIRIFPTLKKAKNALEKQIPKRPNYEAHGYADGGLVYDTAYCPVCEHEFDYGIYEWGSDYCQDCGQALDWSEESEDTE